MISTEYEIELSKSINPEDIVGLGGFGITLASGKRVLFDYNRKRIIPISDTRYVIYQDMEDENYPDWKKTTMESLRGIRKIDMFLMYLNEELESENIHFLIKRMKFFGNTGQEHFSMQFIPEKVLRNFNKDLPQCKYA